MLIELLVVVLIIGILVAVAVPQYQKAVQKSRYATVKNVVKSIADAQEVYYLANGAYANSFEDLDVEVPQEYDATKSSSIKKVYDWGILYTSSSGQTYARYDFPSFSVQYQIAGPYSSAEHAGKVVCTALGTLDAPSAQARFCQNETGKTEEDRTGRSFLMYYFN